MPSDSITFINCLAIKSHAKLIMTWRNDPGTLSMFFTKEPKRWPAFWIEYLDKYINTPNIPGPYFALVNGYKTGFIRLETAPNPIDQSQTSYAISINIAPSKRGKGLGSKILKAITEELTHKMGINSIYAEVLIENTASIKIFKSAGYLYLGEKFVKPATSHTKYKVKVFLFSK